MESSDSDDSSLNKATFVLPTKVRSCLYFWHSLLTFSVLFCIEKAGSLRKMDRIRPSDMGGTEGFLRAHLQLLLCYRFHVVNIPQNKNRIQGTQNFRPLFACSVTLLQGNN